MNRGLLRIVGMVLGLLLLLTTAAVPSGMAQGNAAPRALAYGAIVMEVNTGRVLYAYHADTPLLMASTTKIMTALLCIESNRLDEWVSVPKGALSVHGSSVHLKKDETMPLMELLYGLMLPSGNDAAIAIAIAVDGSTESFCDHMNARAAEMGLLNTHYCNPHGQDAKGHCTTARELAQLASFAMGNETFRTVVASRTHCMTSDAGARNLRNTNRLLGRYAGANGVKTGTTKNAGQCLVFAAERDGTQLCGVVLHAKDRYAAAAALLDYGFAAVALRTTLQEAADHKRNRVCVTRTVTRPREECQATSSILYTGFPMQMSTNPRVSRPAVSF